MREGSDTCKQQVQAINLSSGTTEKGIEGLQAQLGKDLGWIQSHAMAGTTPEECELDQGDEEFKSIACLILKTHLPHFIF